MRRRFKQLRELARGTTHAASTRPMRATRLTLGLMICMLLDFSSPYIGGAFTFNADECFEGVRLERNRPGAPVAVATPLPWLETGRSIRPAPPIQVTRPPASSAWLVEPRKVATSLAADSPAPGEDH